MYTQVVMFNGIFYCVVFRLHNGTPHIIAMYFAASRVALRTWLDQNNYPMKGDLLWVRQDIELETGFYIKPHANDLYYRVREDNNIEQVDASLFDSPLYTYDGF